mmetsp:Transcript_28876/g.66736  ORF Transcript_28876/g.66736 Transcript_28876/m.66736 type:complete len:395 (-) Transcript_28876:494-1678(-)
MQHSHLVVLEHTQRRCFWNIVRAERCESSSEMLLGIVCPLLLLFRHLHGPLLQQVVRCVERHKHLRQLDLLLPGGNLLAFLRLSSLLLFYWVFWLLSLLCAALEEQLRLLLRFWEPVQHPTLVAAVGQPHALAVNLCHGLVRQADRGWGAVVCLLATLLLGEILFCRAIELLLDVCSQLVAGLPCPRDKRSRLQEWQLILVLELLGIKRLPAQRWAVHHSANWLQRSVLTELLCYGRHVLHQTTLSAPLDPQLLFIGEVHLQAELKHQEIRVRFILLCHELQVLIVSLGGDISVTQCHTNCLHDILKRVFAVIHSNEPLAFIRAVLHHSHDHAREVVNVDCWDDVLTVANHWQALGTMPCTLKERMKHVFAIPVQDSGPNHVGSERRLLDVSLG